MRPPERLDVDVRFLLANERTLLAWLRTALALMAGGVALVQLADHRRLLAWTGLALLGLGSVAGVLGYRRFRAADRAIRAGVLPPPGHGLALVTTGVVALAFILIFVYLVG
jgi:inner membrane protein YidH